MSKMDQYSIEETQSGIFHIHIDANRINHELLNFAIKELKFYCSDFNGHPEGYVHFEPEKHLTLKLKTKEEFNSIWKRLESFSSAENLVGYLEGEYVPTDEYIPYREYTGLPVPFQISRRRLTGGRDEEFRQSEIHLTMDKDKSHPKLIKSLLESGLYGAYIEKEKGTFIVLTIQGFIRDITPLSKRIKTFIEKSGGAFSCTIKEERAIKYKLFDVGVEDLPEIIDQINYYEQ